MIAFLLAVVFTFQSPQAEMTSVVAKNYDMRFLDNDNIYIQAWETEIIGPPPSAHTGEFTLNVDHRLFRDCKWLMYYLKDGTLRMEIRRK